MQVCFFFFCRQMLNLECKEDKSKKNPVLLSPHVLMFCYVPFTGLVNYIKFYNFGQLYQLTSLMSATQGPQAEAIQPFLSPLRSQDT